MKESPNHQNILKEGHLWIALIALFIGALGLILRANNAFYDDFVSTLGNTSYTKVHTGRTYAGGLAWIQIETSQKQKRAFESAVNGHTYPLDVALKAAADAGKFSFRAKNGKIAELLQKDESAGYWTIYHNGKRVENSLAPLTLSQGDRYRFVFTQK